MSKNQTIGRWGEKIAEEYLAHFGVETIERNIRTPYGEIDLIVKDQQQIVFVEVKTRTSTNYGFPEQAVTVKKKEHMLQAAQSYIDSHLEANNEWRIDVIAILQEDGKRPKVEWFKYAV